MTRWEYARLESRTAGVNVVFTHQPPWTGLSPDAFFETLRRLGDEGWEVVSVLPLAAEVTSTHTTHSGGPDRERERLGKPLPEPPTTPSTMSFAVGTDRWLLLKRVQPEPPPSSHQTDVIKDLVGKHVLKGRIPLP